jgi:uncharacterized protein
MIVTHYDADGKGCLVLAKKFIKEIGRYSICDYSNVNDIVNDYLDAVEGNKTDDVTLIITDITVSKETARRIEDMKHKFGFLLFIDHHPNNNYYLKNYDWAKLYDSNTSATKALYMYLIEIGLVVDAEYDQFVLSVDEWDTWKWEDTGNQNAKLVNDLAYNLKTHDFLNRFLMNPSLTLSKREKLVLGIREEDVIATIEKIRPMLNGKTCYVFADKYVAEISLHIFETYPDVEILIVLNPINNSISYRSKTSTYNVAEIASRNGGNGHAPSAGSPLNIEIKSKMIDMILADGFKDYTEEEYVLNGK